ncbi:hypothetical protein FRC02_008295 [Tulasnella sp. 418]|nr:hypothetical protein FRC02_008295 [Tulasnella sp. 418]
MAARSPVTCHVLDSTLGRPQKGAKSSSTRCCTKLINGCISATDQDGRCSTLLPSSPRLESGFYKMIFRTGDYFAAAGRETFYPVVEVNLRDTILTYTSLLNASLDKLPFSETRRTLPHSSVAQPLVIYYLSRKLNYCNKTGERE